MKERPILFSAPMVRALLAGTKTQTRRIVKPQPNERRDVIDPTGITRNGWWWTRKDGTGVHSQPTPEAAMKLVQDMLSLWCPYGARGERMWVRETHWQAFKRTPTSNGCVYRADYLQPTRLDPNIANEATWTPSIHMPRWASRLSLEITDVRVERLQEIISTDARAEGVGQGPEDNPRDEYAILWDAINGPGAWAANPWVWAISFRRVAP